jgi:L-glutamine-phosphate cytidylyltransferase
MPASKQEMLYGAPLMKAVILAAGVGSRLAPLTNDRPKALVEVAGRPILLRQLDLLAAAGIPGRDVVIVGGHLIDVLRDTLQREGHGDVTVVFNDMYAPWNNFWSFYSAEPAVRGHDFLQFDGDVILDEKILPRMLAAPGEALLAVDVRDDVDEEMMKVQLAPHGGRVVGLSKKLPPAQCAGEYIGISRLSAAAASLVFAELVTMRDEGITHEYYEYAYLQLMQRQQVGFGIVDVHDCTVIEIDNLDDLQRAEAMVRGA